MHYMDLAKKINEHKMYSPQALFEKNHLVETGITNKEKVYAYIQKNNSFESADMAFFDFLIYLHGSLISD